MYKFGTGLMEGKVVHDPTSEAADLPESLAISYGNGWGIDSGFCDRKASCINEAGVPVPIYPLFNKNCGPKKGKIWQGNETA